MSGQISDDEKRQELAILEVVLDAQRRRQARKERLLDGLVRCLRIVLCILFPPLLVYYGIKYVLTNRP